MATVNDIIRALEDLAPLLLQESYDNAGLQVGDPDEKVSGVLLCLDVTLPLLQEAVGKGCNMVISHHPLIFKGVKAITPLTEQGRLIAFALRNNLAVYSAHTNLDRASQGVSREMAAMLGLEDTSVLCPDPEDPMVGLGAIGTIAPLPTLEFLRRVKQTFSVGAVRYSAKYPTLTISRIALVGGAGASLIPRAIKAGAQAIVTGDIKYHDYTTWGQDILLVDIGHFESELCAKKIFAQMLLERFPDVAMVCCEEEPNPVNIL